MENLKLSFDPIWNAFMKKVNLDDLFTTDFNSSTSQVTFTRKKLQTEYFLESHYSNKTWTTFNNLKIS